MQKRGAMKHKITLEEIEDQTPEYTIASSSEPKEIKRLRLVLDEGIVNYAVEHWANDNKGRNTCVGAWDYTCLNTAVRKHNEI